MHKITLFVSSPSDVALERARVADVVRRIEASYDGGLTIEVIRWEDEGEFTVREESEFPEDTIHKQTDAVLMEGLRQLDESKRPV